MGSVHNEIRYRTELLEQFQKFLSLEHDAGVERLGETLTPIIDFWDQQANPDFCALRREQLWWVSVSKGAVAAQNSFVGVLNKAGSGLLVTVDGWACDVPNASVGSIAQATAVAGITVPVDARDRRFGSSSSIVGVSAYNGSEIPSTNTISWNRFLANTLMLIPVVLNPGNNLHIEGILNTVITACFFGRVRRARDTELNLTGAI